MLIILAPEKCSRVELADPSTPPDVVMPYCKKSVGGTDRATVAIPAFDPLPTWVVI